MSWSAQASSLSRTAEKAQQSGGVRPQQRPAVSVIVLNYNGEKIIGKCLDHLLAQSFDDFEIVVVDNDSRDGSRAIIEQYLGCGRLSIVHSRRNLGVAGGRNLGVMHAQGGIIAFIDNDGYAAPDWLAEAVKTMQSDRRIGVVASLVFFAGRKIVLNGAGGTVNLQGYGGDLCFDVPYEFAQLPRRVLYAMGCGMVVRKDVLDSVGPLDDTLFNYYDDVELGIRTWKSGFEVVVAPDAWVDHGFSYSDKIFGNKVFLCERNRIRTVLKYFPARRLPVWFAREAALCARLEHHLLTTMLKAWLWNLAHLPSALKWRVKFALRRRPFQHLLDPSWGPFPPPTPNNQAHRPDPARARPVLALDGKGDHHQLIFGWYYPENDGTVAFRWSAPVASALFRLRKPALNCSLTFLATAAPSQPCIAVRPLGSLDVIEAASLRAPAAPGWHTRSVPMHLPAGDYELILRSEPGFLDHSGRRLGLAVASIGFE
jgi:GT2 family glycosyltransferase